MRDSRRPRRAGRLLLLVSLLITMLVYWPGLSGSWLFDDYPNIVDNPGVQLHEVSVPALARAALSSPASEFKRPLASLSFAANYLLGGLDPYGWKLVNLVIHLLNGVLVFLVARMLLNAISSGCRPSPHSAQHPQEETRHVNIIAALIAASWMLLPINLTAVLYVVQREESMANLFVLLGLLGYVSGRRRMLRCMQGNETSPGTDAATACGKRLEWSGFWLCTTSLLACTSIGVLVKETAVMLPLYALLVEWMVFRFRRPLHAVSPAGAHPVRECASAGHPQAVSAHALRSQAEAPPTRSSGDKRIGTLFLLVLVLPMLAGLGWLLPHVLAPATWATRDFTLDQRLLSEARIVCDYIAWTLLPTPHALSFYHDQFPVSTGWLKPWTTLAGTLLLAALVTLVFALRRRKPLVALGLALFLGCQLLTGTILPLELVYEHRNYFASLGLLLAVVPWLANGTGRYPWIRHALLVVLMLWWTGLTAATAYAWGDPLRLARQLAERAPDSPRAQYELGRTYIIYSHYNPVSPYTRLAYTPLEKAASFPESSILPQQALIFMNSRMGLPLKAQWWDSMTAKLTSRPPGVQDESSLAALTKCARDGACRLPVRRMVQAFNAALSHPTSDARLYATYGDYAWNVLGKRDLGERMTAKAVAAAPGEPAYHITLVRMLVASGHEADARKQMQALRALNIGGRLDTSIKQLDALLPALQAKPSSD